MSARSGSRFLELRALAALEHLRFGTRHRIEGSFSGRHPSRRQGGAGEFADFREYTEGEDIRRLDWKVLARTGHQPLPSSRPTARAIAAACWGGMMFATAGL